MPPYVGLPEVDAASVLEGRATALAEAEVTNDYGTPNLLFLYYIPPITDEQRNDLEAAKTELQSWNAWELSAAEDQVQKQLRKGTLPGDDSAESRARRTNYRAQVVTYLRENSENAWLGPTQSPQDDAFNQVVKKSEVNGVIRRVLRDHYAAKRKPRQMSVAVNILSDVAASNPGSANNKFYLTQVFYNWDATVRGFRPDIQVSSLSVTQTPDRAEEDSVALKVEVLDSVFVLDRAGWNEASGGTQAAIRAGEKIRREMALDFYLET
ncbi:uncharacterized protein MAM_01066 [Metarhizium album ARSEF 1941]|uniref:Uncharacterized protein n=1 Tax=Metarhizium album (strain ARSEF 1941) TaxID=1081103 RepID=A0A0B2X916_METAS|nr:uncharacterized protein MAM_01066 [Metarhizium album ARSEF 1941]KHO02065.1 hypothetical protein MAM_01066 [Metarhizium album ARSEF 1941]